MTAGKDVRLDLERVLIADAFGGFYNDDQLAIRAGAQRDGLFYTGPARTPGFRAIREPARALSIGLVLSDGYVAWGDAMTVQYSGVAGRDCRRQRAAPSRDSPYAPSVSWRKCWRTTMPSQLNHPARDTE